MAPSLTIDVPLNRVEGDLEVRAQLDGDRVSDAWSAGTMFRGFETILCGRGALDSLVITPRICGICGTSHLTAAVLALEAVAGIAPPPDAVRLRNVALATEHIQSDMRHGFLMFAADFANPAHSSRQLFQEAVRRYAPLRGAAAIETIRETKKVLEIVAILGGQWPHSSYMVPGGIVSLPSPADLLRCRLLLRHYRDWYERWVLGCPLERWLAVGSVADLDAWLDEQPSHRECEVGFLVRFARDLGLDRLGRGCGCFVSFGSLPLPEGTRVAGHRGRMLVPAGFARLASGSDRTGAGIEVTGFDQGKVAEHVAHSWFTDYEGGRHPFEGRTEPYASGDEGQKYSWAKAPRYDGHPAETGPLAEAVVAGNPLFLDFLARSGPSALARELARLGRAATLIPAMETWLEEIGGGPFYTPAGDVPDGQGFGLTEAARGALGHWVTIEGGQVRRYQIITPTAWNASPRDSAGVRGPIEEALVGTRVANSDDPVELGHVVRSFDPCLVCTVHAARANAPAASRPVRV